MIQARPAAPPESHDLVRGLTTWDAILITVGSIVGTGIFITTADIARVVPHGGVILVLWVAGGLLTLAGALTYGELGAMFPRAGGQYHFLKEAYGPLWGFLFGWASFLVIMSGGIAALAVGFGQYLGAFLPVFSTTHVLLLVPLGPLTWSLNGAQLAGAGAIALLSAVNYVGLREGARLQNALTAVKIGSLLAIGVLGLMIGGRPLAPELGAALPAGGGLLPAMGVGMIAVLWTFDGWYNLTFSAGEIRDPERSLPRGLVLGTSAVTLLYLLVNTAYLRALPVGAMAATDRIGETAATALLGPVGGRLIVAAVLISTFGCIASTILCCSRIYLAMAQEGVFFRTAAVIHQRYRTPGVSIATQGAWAMVLALSGTYAQLYTYVVFAALIFHAMTGSAVLVLRSTRPDAARPYRVWGYPWVPVLFVVATLAVVANTVVEQPRESLLGLLLVVMGVPVYSFLKRRVPERVW
jgi:APA family basic amino acid/polyamine antiporter